MHERNIFKMTLREHVWHVTGHWRLLILASVLAALCGVVVALLLKPVYQSNATIRPREGAQSALMGLGTLNQTSSPLTRLEASLKSRDLAIDVLNAHPDFLGWLFPVDWDSVAGDWKKDRRQPSLLQQAGTLQDKITTRTSLRAGTLFVRILMDDPNRAQVVLAAYLERLNYMTRQLERQDADSNRVFMERELLTTEDPNLRIKMQAMINSELERAYLMRNRAFDIVEAPALFEQRVSPQRRKIVVFFFLGGLALGGVLMYVGPLLAWWRSYFRNGASS